ncbi:MAG: HAMP domain-containing histidine kinase [Bacteroidetes bacterium]|nr:HAMP domain-containing histidine kinase [Bacteroidota bacterium]MBP6640901.1 HAMP domain-containing histidine kinase [Bacteroidia bacterium]MBP6722922.1 HAMP domain-containing histidine kinase [Bacteroidia bacterium]
MRTRRTILLLAGLTFVLVLALMIWQLSSLQGLRMQIAAGLHGSLQQIANSAARQLQQDYLRQMDDGMLRLKRSLKAEDFRERNLNQMRKSFLLASASQQLCNAWVVAFPARDQSRFRSYEYKSPSRYRLGDRSLGSWRDQTDLTEFIRKELDKMAEPYGAIDNMANTIWSSALDSNLVLVYNKDFSSNTLIGAPIFDEKGNLLCLVFRQTDPVYFQKVYLRDFFHLRFWPDEEPEEGLEKRFLQFGVLRGQGGQLIYHSVAYGLPQFEHQAPLANFGPWLGDLRLGVSFREANVEEVTQSIYLRNLYLILALFAILMVVLLLLVRAAMQLFRVSRLKTEFVANVSHEIKTPLATIRLATDSLRLNRLKDPESMQRVLGIINEEAERLDYLIHNLLDFSQLETGRKKYNRRPIYVQELWELLSAFAKRQVGPPLELDLKKLDNSKVSVDPKAIEQALSILIDNARKYGQGDERLVLGAEMKRNQLRIYLQDFGPGIAPRDQKLIFEKFVRIGNLEEHNVKGHGIGLSIARAIIKDHDGALELKSAVGEGATFSICLPCIQELVQ